MQTKTISIKESNNFIINILAKNNSFSIIRLGHDIGMVAVAVLENIEPDIKHIEDMDYYDGIYCENNEQAKEYGEIYNNSIRNSDALACFPMLKDVQKQQHIYLNKFQLPALHNRVLEPFYCSLEGFQPWTQYLDNKKVLIISPFTKSFKEQHQQNFKIFKKSEKQIFVPSQEFIFYKCFNTLAGNHLHKNWRETLDIMCNEITQIDFDIALLGCGGYGVPLCYFIKSHLDKSAIYIGGGLQLLFGVMGKRWENMDLWREIIEENGTKFVYPTPKEKIDNYKVLCGGSYW